MLFQWISRQLRLRQTTVALEVIFGAVVFSFLLGHTLPVHAQQVVTQNLTTAETGLGGKVQTNIGLPTTDIRVIVANVIRVAFGLLGVVFLVLVLYAGFLWMTAGGNEERIATAKKMLQNGIVGLAVMLSAYAIVSYVIGKLLGAVNGGGGGSTNQSMVATQVNSFGSGGLGTVIKDHYPARDQTNVPRNTKIIITFFQPILASSIIDDTNHDGVYGDCINQGKNMNWNDDCDKLKSDAGLISIKRADNGDLVTGAAALTSGPNGQVDTVVIRPITALGSQDVTVPYTVNVGSGVLWDDATNNNPSIFAGRLAGHDFYEWTFTCSTVLDTTPPHVTGVFPKNNTTEDKNSIIQINFSKPMDPTGLQGSFADKSGYFGVPGNTVFLQSSKSSLPAGNFRLVNNYQTLEFTPSAACGVNSCGGTVYCLPVCDAPGASCQQDIYTLLMRAGVAFSNSSFEGVPFSGAMDLSGNVLDGNNDGTVDTAPQTGVVFTDETAPDNYFWHFTLADNLDVSSPYIKQVTPGPEGSYVAADNELSLLMSKRMSAGSLYSIDIAEVPPSSDPLWHRPLITYNTNSTTFDLIQHGPFLNNARHYYYPVVDSRVEDVHFNCFYPGMGPTPTSTQSGGAPSLICDTGANAGNCCPVTSNPSNAFCCNGLTNLTSRDQCLANLSAH